MLPGKKYTPEEVLRILWTRKWFVIVPFVAIGVAAAAYVRQLPDLFKSETLILVVPQRIPDSYVKSTVTSKIEDRLPTIQQQILSSSRLERIINDYGLYTPMRERALMEDVVQRMRTDINVRIEQGDSFRVSYISPDAVTAQRVTERLASLFIEENLRDRENLAESTNEFLDTQLEDAKRRLVDHERRLEEYRRRFAGQLPTQLTSNLQVIQNAQQQLQNVAESTSQDRERRLLLERQIGDLLQEPADAPPVVAGQGDAAQAAASPAQQLAMARERLKLQETRFTADHPDVRALRRSIAELEVRVQAEAKATGEVETAPAVTPVERTRQRRLRDLRAEMQNLDAQLEQKRAEEARLKALIAEYQGKVDAVPTRESELVDLTRDYATLQSSYANLAAKREDSKMAANLERRQVGEQFKVLDPPKAAGKPFSPNRLQLNLLGAAAGLLIGLGLVALLEYRDSSFKTDDEVLRCLGLPVLAVVPNIVSPADLTRRARLRRLAGLTAGIVVTVASLGAYAWWRTQL